MRPFIVTMYLRIEAKSEKKAREILDSLELESPYKDSIFWNRDTTELVDPAYM